MDRVCPAFRITIPTLALQGMIGRIASAPPPRAQPSTSTRTSIWKKAATGACTRVHWSSPRRRLSRESRLVSSRREERLVAQGRRFYPASPPLPYPDRVPACVRACVRARVAEVQGARSAHESVPCTRAPRAHGLRLDSRSRFQNRAAASSDGDVTRHPSPVKHSSVTHTLAPLAGPLSHDFGGTAHPTDRRRRRVD